MDNYYRFFQCDVDKAFLLRLFDEQHQEGNLKREKNVYDSVDPKLLMQQAQPIVDLDYELNPHDVMLSLIDRPTMLHCNPNNNGLLMIPLRGKLNFDFYSYQPRIVDGRTQFLPQEETPNVLSTLVHSLRDVDRPIAVNGRMVHNYWGTDSAVFYARKIPSVLTWTYVLERL